MNKQRIDENNNYWANCLENEDFSALALVTVVFDGSALAELFERLTISCFSSFPIKLVLNFVF